MELTDEQIKTMVDKHLKYYLDRIKAPEPPIDLQLDDSPFLNEMFIESHIGTLEGIRDDLTLLSFYPETI